VRAQIDAARLETLQVEILHVVGRGLENHLELVVLEEPVRVLPKPPVGGPPRRLDVRDVPGLRAEHAQECLRMHRAGAELDVQRLLDQTPLRGPVVRQFQNQIL
jgi:hypothetical protein